jgi:hypothetical protein
MGHLRYGTCLASAGTGFANFTPEHQPDCRTMMRAAGGIVKSATGSCYQLHGLMGLFMSLTHQFGAGAETVGTETGTGTAIGTGTTEEARMMRIVTGGIDHAHGRSGGHGLAHAHAVTRLLRSANPESLSGTCYLRRELSLQSRVSLPQQSLSSRLCQ